MGQSIIFDAGLIDSTGVAVDDQGTTLDTKLAAIDGDLLSHLYWHEAAGSFSSAANTDGTYNFASLIPSGATLIAPVFLGYNVGGSGATWNTQLIPKNVSKNDTTFSYRTQGGSTTQTYTVRFGMLLKL